MKPRIATLMSLFLVVVALCSCNNEAWEHKISSITVQPMQIDEIFVGETIENLVVEVEGTDDFFKSDINLVMGNSFVASFDYSLALDKDFKTYISCNITGKVDGTTYFYFETADGKIKSNVSRITVVENNKSKLVDEQVVYAFNQTNEQEEKHTDETEKKTQGIVYITPSGKKYHLSADCAGKNAIATDVESAKRTYEPCKRCS